MRQSEGCTLYFTTIIMTQTKNIVTTLTLFLLCSLAGHSQSIDWTELSQSLDSASFKEIINPQKYNVASNNLTDIEKWNSDNKISGDSLYNLLANWEKYPTPKQTGIICEYKIKLDTNYTVPFLVYIPKNYDPKQKTTLLLYFKGGWFSKNKLAKEYAKEIINDNPTFSYLDKNNVIEIFPALESDLIINYKYGYKHLEGMIAQTKKLFNIDDNKVFLSGFSDGGKTVYLAANQTATPFACFYPINGAIIASPDFPNYVNRPIYSFVAEKDELNDYKSISTKAEYANKIGANWTYRKIPNEGHFYFPYQQKILPLLFSSLKNTNRNPLPNKIEYNRAFNDDKDFKGIDWIQIKVNSDKKPNEFHRTDSIETFWGDGESYNYRYGSKVGQLKAHCFGNTYFLTTSLIDEITIYVSPLMVNLDLPIKVILNGKEMFSSKVEYLKEFMANRFIANFDRQQIFINKIVVKADQ